MKNILTVAFVGLLMLSPEISQATDNQAVNKTEMKENFDKGRRTKSGRYKKKKGFLWGLFKGKNSCDCPKTK